MNAHVQGYTVVEDFFSPEELQPCRDAIANMVDVLATKLHDAGKITGRLGRPSMLSFKYMYKYFMKINIKCKDFTCRYLTILSTGK